MNSLTLSDFYDLPLGRISRFIDLHKSTIEQINKKNKAPTTGGWANKRPRKR